MSYTVYHRTKEYEPRKGLEGPFHYPNGRVLYYDVKEGQYYDPLTDFYVEYDEMKSLEPSLVSGVFQDGN